MSKVTPVVSIIMATYNRAQYIVESIKSIQAQTFANWECIIIDDGGTDNTAQVLQPILKEDKRFSYQTRIKKYEKGLPGSRNYGLDLAKGDYIIFFDDDDIVHPQNLEICLEEFAKSDISFCRYIRKVFRGDFKYEFDLSKEYSHFYIDKSDIYKMVLNELQFNSCAVMWTKACFENHRFTEHLKYAEEWELYSRIITSVNKGVSIDKDLFYGRKHEVSVTGNFNNKNVASLKSFADAIFLVTEDLNKKQLLSDEILRYFVQVSLDYKDYNLFERMMRILDYSALKKLKWKAFYKLLPLRLFLYRAYKKRA